MMRVWMPLPHHDFDPSEVAVPWKILTERKVEVVFATPNGGLAQADQIMVDGKALKIFGPMLSADANARRAYEELLRTGALERTTRYADVDVSSFDGVILPGGHAPSMRDYLESAELQAIVGEFFAKQKIVGAICHGVVLASRCRVSGSDHSVLYGRRITALPKRMELSAWALTCLWMGSYYRTYPETVESEILRALKQPEDLDTGPWSLRRDSIDRPDLGHVVRDRNLVTARWPGDVHRFALEVFEALRASAASSSSARA